VLQGKAQDEAGRDPMPSLQDRDGAVQVLTQCRVEEYGSVRVQLATAHIGVF
jgi:hypothetical protein